MKQSQNNTENKISWEDIKEYILDRQPYDYKSKPVKMDDVILIDNNAYIKETIIEWLDEVRNSDKLKDYNILPTKTLFLTGAPGLGKAQPLTSHVFTPTGYKTMEEIKLGDKVIDGKGEITEVIGTFLQGKRNCYRIHFKDNSYIEVADNHLNSVIIHTKKGNKQFDLETKELINFIKTHKSVRVPVPVINCWTDNNIDIDPYLLGCLIGDGCLVNGLKGFANIDKDIINRVDYILRRDYGLYLEQRDKVNYRFKSIIPHNRRWYFSYKNKPFTTFDNFQKDLKEDGYNIKFGIGTFIEAFYKHGYKNPKILQEYPELKNKIRIYEDKECLNGHPESSNGGKVLEEQLRKYNLLCKSYYKHIPYNYLYSSYNTRVELLRGLMDTDGYIALNSRGGCRMEFGGVSPQLNKDFAQLVRSLGCVDTTSIGPAGYKDKNGNYIKCQDCYGNYIKFPNNLIPFYCKRKVNRIRPRQTEPLRKIKNIEYIGKKDCKCILVKSDTHQYITDNLTVTHNTYMAKAVATELKWPMYIIDVAGVMKQNGLDALIKIFSFVRDPQNQPCILFLDECDGVARSREEKGSSADKAGDNRITNYIMQVLQEENDNIDSQLIIFAATNFPEGIDEAFLNRFQIQLMYYLPEDYVPFIKLEMKKNKMFTLIEDVDPELIKSINIEANNAKFSIRALNAKILWIYKQTLLQKIKNHDLHGEVIEIKLSTIMQSIANDIKFGMDIDKIQDDEKRLKNDFKDIVENASETEEKEI